jgi:hypothetical protein
MSKEVLRAIALGIGGLVVALVLTVGAFAIAGQDISQPAGVPIITVTPSPSSGQHGTEDEHSPDPNETASTSVDDHGAGANPDDGGAAATEGPDDHGSGSGSGSDDHGGSSGSSSPGSGSSSGSGSDPSGSGSGSDDSGGHGDD